MVNPLHGTYPNENPSCRHLSRSEHQGTAVTVVSSRAGCRQRGEGGDTKAVFSSLSTWRISKKHQISTLKKELIQNKQHCGLAALPEVWADDR